MTDTITVDLDRAKQLVEEVAAEHPDKVDDTTLYFDPENGECLCIVGAVIEKLGKSYQDMGIRPASKESWYANHIGYDPNAFDFTAITVDGVEFTDEAVIYLDEARSHNDRGLQWIDIPRASIASLKSFGIEL